MQDADQGWFISELYHDTLEIIDSYHMHQNINQNAQKEVEVLWMDNLSLTRKNKTDQSCNKNSSYRWTNWLQAYHTNQRQGFMFGDQGTGMCRLLGLGNPVYEQSSSKWNTKYKRM